MPRLFTIMPFGKRPAEHSEAGAIDFDEVYHLSIKPAAASAAWDVLRIDEVLHPGNIVGQYIRELATADLVIADISIPNPNVFYELGIRHSISPAGTVLIAYEGTHLPFDIINQRVI